MVTPTSLNDGGIERSNEAKVVDEVVQQLSINVYVGDPLDLQTTRHTGFLIEWSDGDNLVIHVMGSHEFFELEEIWNGPKPSRRDGCIRSVPVVTWSTSRDEKFKVRNILRDTPINNSERGWNCQNWIGDALQILEARGLISSNAVRKASDEMVDAIMEAKDGE